MLPTFVIGLREGLEAALIVGIIAAFLRKQGRRDLLRWVLVGVGIAVALCFAAGIALHVLQKDLPQRQQEGLETVIGAIAVGMVTYMVIWMKRHSRDLKGQLEGMTQDAMGAASAGARAMIAMAFLAVLREGLETVVFLLAAFNQSTSGAVWLDDFVRFAPCGIGFHRIPRSKATGRQIHADWVLGTNFAASHGLLACVGRRTCPNWIPHVASSQRTSSGTISDSSFSSSSQSTSIVTSRRALAARSV